MTTQKQIEANRRNAGRSTGPRQSSARPKYTGFDRAGNRHTILATAVVLGKLESWDMFNGSLQEFRNAWQPVGHMEEVLVEKVAIAYWKMRRMLLAEAAEVARSTQETVARAVEHALTEKTPERQRETLERDHGPAKILVTRAGVHASEFALNLASYHMQLEREFYRAIRTLLRIQEIRKGYPSATAVLEYDGL